MITQTGLPLDQPRDPKSTPLLDVGGASLSSQVATPMPIKTMLLDQPRDPKRKAYSFKDGCPRIHAIWISPVIQTSTPYRIRGFMLLDQPRDPRSIPLRLVPSQAGALASVEVAVALFYKLHIN
jgi:hypothetical protein